MAVKYEFDQIPSIKNDSEKTIFDPVFYNLDSSFRLTSFTQLKGWGCKIPQEVLMNLLLGLEDDSHTKTKDETEVNASKKIGINSL